MKRSLERPLPLSKRITNLGLYPSNLSRNEHSFHERKQLLSFFFSSRLETTSVNLAPSLTHYKLMFSPTLSDPVFARTLGYLRYHPSTCILLDRCFRSGWSTDHSRPNRRLERHQTCKNADQQLVRVVHCVRLPSPSVSAVIVPVASLQAIAATNRCYHTRESGMPCTVDIPSLSNRRIARAAVGAHTRKDDEQCGTPYHHYSRKMRWHKGRRPHQREMRAAMQKSVGRGQAGDYCDSVTHSVFIT